MTKTREQYPHLIEPNLLENPSIPLGRWAGRHLIARPLEQRAAEIAAEPLNHMPDINVVIDARRPRYPAALAENRDDYHGRLAGRVVSVTDNIRSQEYRAGAVQRVLALVEADAHFSDRMKRRMDDVEVVPVDPHHTHPQALNTAIQMLGERPGITVMTEARATFATNQAFKAAAMGIDRGAVAVFGTMVPDHQTSLPESILYHGSARIFRTLRKLDSTPRPGPGYAAANRAGYDQEVLFNHPFNSAYERGGADGNWGERMRNAGYELFYDPAMSVRLSVGATSISDVRTLLHEYGQYAHPNRQQ